MTPRLEFDICRFPSQLEDDGVDLLTKSALIWQAVKEQIRPTYIVSMVSGGKDSSCSHAVALELGIHIDAVIHGDTRTGIPDTTQFVIDNYNPIVADAGTTYEDYVLRKGFFGKGISAHAFSYRLLKADPFRKIISKHFRKRKHGVRIAMLNGARKDESANRQKHLQIIRRDPSSLNNIWVNLIHHWNSEARDKYLKERCVAINPVAKALCRSGECMCGTMQTKEERWEAASLYPKWGQWLDALENEARERHGFGWGENYSSRPDPRQQELFQPMCTDCVKNV